jgi:multidrug efflux system outer membrane protein
MLCALAAGGCASPPAIDASRLPAVPASFAPAEGRWTTAAPAVLPPAGEWWKAFADPVLDALQAQAMQRNDRIQVAAARLQQARAVLRTVEARRLPLLGFSAGASRGTQPATGSTAGGQFFAGLGLSYEADVFGRIARASDAASLDAASRSSLLRSAQLLIQAEVAQAYFGLRALDAEKQIVNDTVQAFTDTLKLTQARFRAGDVAELDVARVHTEKAAAESQAFAVQRERTELEHALAVLVGEVATNFSVAAQPLQGVPPVIPAGVPSTVLARRPDVSAARESLLAAQARVGVAQAAWFPELQLTASGGVSSSQLADVFKWSARSWGIGALLSLPIFDGRREGTIAAAAAEMDAALYAYREQILVAFRDVEDQLSALHLLDGQARAETQAVASASRATALSRARYRNGLISQLELLDAQRNELRSRRMETQVRALSFQATVRLVRALGGAWDEGLAQTAEPGAR